MSGNVQNRTVKVSVGPHGVGRVLVQHHLIEVEMVTVRSAHGTPHVLEAQEHPGHVWIEVLGAVPDTEVSVAYHVED